tara:strand:- start:343 stop:477 length:135 start_codon:yes stop_codon:yes gene_type:complete
MHETCAKSNRNAENLIANLNGSLLNFIFNFDIESLWIVNFFNEA